MFSHFLDDFVGVPNVFALARSDLQRQGRDVVDLASGNVQDIGIMFPGDILRRSHELALLHAEKYAPHSKGQRVLREAIARYYGEGHATPSSMLDPEHIIVTPGTSQSYWYLFLLLANPGEEILVPRPVYPLFEYIAKLCHVTLVYYDLKIAQDSELATGGRWVVDIDSLRRAITSHTKAIVLISPHNPTGHVLSRSETTSIAHLACEYELPLIIDEVFYEFVYDDSIATIKGILPQREAFRDCPLVFTLNGFSKMFALPGLKIGWMVASGHPAFLTPALSALETIADTFLSTNEVAQFVAADIFQSGRDFLQNYKQQLRTRWQASKSAYTIAPSGGFYGVKFFDASDSHVDEDTYVLDLLNTHGILVHPGYFYGLDRPGIVFSFLRDTPKILR